MGRVFGDRVATGKSVIDSALERIRHAYSVSDHQVVLFSGGKDSSVLLNLVIAVATDLGRLPVPVLFIDEEAIPPETVDYVRRVMLRGDVALTWSCVPVKHRNACARSQPWWFPWKADERQLWCRPLPDWATTEQHRPDIPHLAIPDQMGYWCPSNLGTTVQFLGRRCQESLTRYRMVARRRGPEAFMSKAAMEEWSHIRTADPLYDLSVEDVWLAMHTNGWDYNRAYDIFAQLGISPQSARIAPPYGEEPSRNLWMFKQGWPHLWDKMQSRVEGADCAARYSRTVLYQYGGVQSPGADETWRDFTTRLLLNWPEETRKTVAENIVHLIEDHKTRCKRILGRVEPLPDTDRHRISGISWKELAKVAGRGVLKQRTLSQISGYRGN